MHFFPFTIIVFRDPLQVGRHTLAAFSQSNFLCQIDKLTMRKGSLFPVF